MKTHQSIQIRAGDLKPVVAGLGKLIPRKASLPALQCVKVEMVKRDTLRLTATDLNLTLAIEVPATVGKGVEPSPAPFLIPLERLRDLVRRTGANEALDLGPAVKAPAPDEFPEATTFRASPIPLPDSAASGLVHAFACASRDTTRHILQGAFLDTSGKGAKAHRIVGTDGRHLFSSNSLYLPKVKGPVILPDHKLWQWKPLAESRPWTLRLGAEKDGIVPFRIDGPHWSVTGKTVEGNYPNYRQVIPPSDQFKTRVTMSDPALEAINRLIPRLPGKKLANSPVGLHLEKGRLGLLARESNDEPWILHPIDTVATTGPDLCSFVNRDYLQKAVDFGLGEIHLIDAMSPVQFSREGDLMIVMPIRAIDPERIERPKLTPAVMPSIPKQKNAAPEKAEKSTPSRRKPKAKPERSERTDPADPIDEVASRIAEANEAIASAGKQLQEATGSLKTARRQRREDREELRGFRSLFSSIKKITTGSN
ncbi:MAG: DNA polymerase III subunit beta [Verrucomicrobiales bacterium]|nr:DNA polymerase III subunit beta [Verrucomicrobiales bacterium]